MAYPVQRSHHQALLTGATDGKYQKHRRDTEVGPDNALGNHLTLQDKATLNPLDGYVDIESPVVVTPNTF